MPHQVRSQERLGLLISKRKKDLGPSSEGAKGLGMRAPQVRLRGILATNRVAPAQMKQEK